MFILLFFKKLSLNFDNMLQKINIFHKNCMIKDAIYYKECFKKLQTQSY